MNNPIITYRGRNYTHEGLLERLEAGEKLLHKMMIQYKADIVREFNENWFDTQLDFGNLPTFQAGIDFLTDNGISPTFNLY